MQPALLNCVWATCCLLFWQHHCTSNGETYHQIWARQFCIAIFERDRFVLCRHLWVRQVCIALKETRPQSTVSPEDGNTKLSCQKRAVQNCLAQIWWYIYHHLICCEYSGVVKFQRIPLSKITTGILTGWPGNLLAGFNRILNVRDDRTWEIRTFPYMEITVRPVHQTSRILCSRPPRALLMKTSYGGTEAPVLFFYGLLPYFRDTGGRKKELRCVP